MNQQELQQQMQQQQQMMQQMQQQAQQNGGKGRAPETANGRKNLSGDQPPRKQHHGLGHAR